MNLIQGFLTYPLSFLVIITVVVFVHELGHFLVARWNGVRVEVFSIGFGRELWGFNDRYGTRWRVSLLPLGGYVKFFGDADAASMTRAEMPAEGDAAGGLSAEERAASFPAKSLRQRAAIVAAGPLANFAFAIVVFAVLFMTVGRLTTPAVIGEVVPGSAAERAGLLPGDRITSIQGEAVVRFEDVQRLVQLYGTAPISIVYERAGTLVTTQAAPVVMDHTDAFGNPQRVPILGVRVDGSQAVMETYGPIGAIGAAVENTWTVTASTLVAFGQMIAGDRGTEDLGGPLRIAQYSGQAAQLGLVSFISFIAILSVNLGLINLFPVPMLDGGHLLFYAVEGMRGRPLGERAQEYGLRLGLALVFGLMIFATWNDIARWVDG